MSWQLVALVLGLAFAVVAFFAACLHAHVGVTASKVCAEIARAHDDHEYAMWQARLEAAREEQDREKREREKAKRTN